MPLELICRECPPSPVRNTEEDAYNETKSDTQAQAIYARRIIDRTSTTNPDQQRGH